MISKLQNIFSRSLLFKFFKNDFLIQKDIQRSDQSSTGLYNSFIYYVLLYKQFFSIQKINYHKTQIDFVFFCSDETQLKNQLPVIKLLINKSYNVTLITNKKRILELANSNNIETCYLSTNLLLKGNYFLIKTLESQISKIVKYNKNLKWIIIGNDLRWDDRIICKAFQNKGIRTAVINHGLNLISERLQYMICDFYFAWSSSEKNRIIQSGYMKENILVSGSPALDTIIFSEKFEEQSAIDCFIEQYIGKEKDIILVTFSGPGGMISEINHKECIQKIESEFNLLTQHNFVPVVKLHPKDKIDHYKEFIEKKGGIVIPKNNPSLNSNIYPWLKRAFALISGPSGSIVDCMLLDKPAIYLDVQKEGIQIDFIKNKIIPAISDDLSLFEILQNLKNDKNLYRLQIEKQTAYLETIFRRPDGHSASRIVELLIS